MLLYIRWITKSIPNPKEIYLTQRKSILRRGELVAFFFLYPYATDKRRERLRKRKKSLLLAKHLSLGFSLSRKRAAFRGTKVSDEKYIRQKRQSSSWTGEQNLQQTRQCGKVVEVGLITANTAPNSPQNHAKMAPSENPARTSVKKCLLSAIRLQPTNRNNETATTCSNGLSNLVSVLTAA